MGVMHDIRLKIGTVFSGEGLELCKERVLTANNQLKSAARGAGQMSAALSELDSSAAKAANAATGLVSAFMTGNVMLIASQGAMLAISYAMTQVKEKADAAKEAANELARVMHEKFSAAISSQISEAIDEMARLRAEFESITKAANSMRSATDALSGAQSRGGIADLEVEKFKAVLEAESGNLARLAAAEHDLGIVRAKEAASAAEWAAKVESARALVVQADERASLLSTSLAKATEERVSMEKVLAAEGGTSKELIAAVNRLKAEEMKLSISYNDALSASRVSKVQLATVEQESANAAKGFAAENVRAAIAVRDVQAAIQKEADAAAEKVAKEERKKALDAERDAINSELKDAEAHLRDVTEAQREARQNLTDAERKLAAAEEEYYRNLQMRQTRAALAGGSLLDGESRKAREGFSAQRQFEDDFSKHLSVWGDDQARKLGAKLQRDSDSQKEAFYRMQEEQRYARLSETSRKGKSQADLDFMDKYEARRAREQAEDSAAESARAESADALERISNLEKVEVEAKEAIVAIKEKLTDLGLK